MTEQELARELTLCRTTLAVYAEPANWTDMTKD